MGAEFWDGVYCPLFFDARWGAGGLLRPFSIRVRGGRPSKEGFAELLGGLVQKWSSDH